MPTKLATLPSPAFQVSLRIRHTSIDPADISKEMRIEPEHSFRAGQPRPSRPGVTPGAVHTATYWLAPLNPWSWFGNPSSFESLDLSVTQEQIDAAIARNLSGALYLYALRLSRAHTAFLHKIRSEGGEISLLVALSPTAVDDFSLPPQVTKAFGELGITLKFEITNDW